MSDFYESWLRKRYPVYRDIPPVPLTAGRPPFWLVDLRPSIKPPPRQANDVCFHEAGHFVVGLAIGYEVSNPRRLVENEKGHLGKVSVPQADPDVDLDLVPPAALRALALDMSAFYLAGDLAACLAVGIVQPGSTVLQNDGEDLANARRVLRRAGIEGDRGLVWSARYAERMLRYAWRHVVEVAEEVRVKPPATH